MSIFFHHIKDKCTDQFWHYFKNTLVIVWFCSWTISNEAKTILDVFLESFKWINNFYGFYHFSLFLIIIFRFNGIFLGFTKIKWQPMGESFIVKRSSDIKLCESSHIHEIHCWIDILAFASSSRFLKGYSNTKRSFFQNCLCLKTDQLIFEKLFWSFHHNKIFKIWFIFSKWWVCRQWAFVFTNTALKVICGFNSIINEDTFCHLDVFW